MDSVPGGGRTLDRPRDPLAEIHRAGLVGQRPGTYSGVGVETCGGRG